MAIDFIFHALRFTVFIFAFFINLYLERGARYTLTDNMFSGEFWRHLSMIPESMILHNFWFNKSIASQ